MKKAIGAVICGLALLASVSAAMASRHGGGFVPDPNSPNYGRGVHGRRTVTVAEAQKMRDDAHVIVEGYIVEEVRHEKYLFSDNTGQIVVKIDDDDWRGVRVGPNDRVCIHGEVDRDWDKLKIDVDRIHLAGN